MAIDFPASPTVGQEFASGGMIYVFNGTGWTIKGGSTTALASTAYVDAQVALKVAKAGDTMSGQLTVAFAGYPGVVINDTNKSGAGFVVGQKAGVNRWGLQLGNATPESGSNSGANFELFRYDDGGVGASQLSINRATGSTSLTGDFTVVKANPILNLYKTASGQSNTIVGGVVGTGGRWSLIMGNSAAEAAGNVGSDFNIARHDNAGTYIDSPFTISRAGGDISFYQDVWLAKANGAIRFNTGGRYLYHNGTDFCLGGGNLTIEDNKSLFCYSGTFNGAVAVAGNITSTGTVVSSNYMACKNAFYLDAGAAGINMTLQLRDINQTNRGGIYFDNALDEICTIHGVSSVRTRIGSWGLASSHDSCFKPAGGPWITGSDERIKTVHGDYQHGLDEVLALHPVVYSYKGNDVFGKALPPDAKDAKDASLHSSVVGKEFVGLVAQECEGVLPEMVSQVSGFIDGQAVDDLRTLDTGPLVYALVNAVKTLAARVAELESRISVEKSTTTSTPKKR